MLRRMKQICLAGIMVGCLSAPVFAADYSSMSTEEMAAMRGTLQDATQEERSSFQSEWRNRMQQMSPEDRQQYKKGAGAGPQDGSAARNRERNKEQKRAGNQVREERMRRMSVGTENGSAGGSGGSGLGAGYKRPAASAAGTNRMGGGRGRGGGRR